MPGRSFVSCKQSVAPVGLAIVSVRVPSLSRGRRDDGEHGMGEVSECIRKNVLGLVCLSVAVEHRERLSLGCPCETGPCRPWRWASSGGLRLVLLGSGLGGMGEANGSGRTR